MRDFLLLLLLLTPQLSQAGERIVFGRFQSRAIFHASDSAQCPAPLVILIPGSGANGPEEQMPGSRTGDGNDHSLFEEFSEGLWRAHVGTLAVGKPGVDFFHSWNRDEFFYDRNLYRELRWQDLIENLKDATELARTLPCVDANRIYVLGHSEGTQVAVDFAAQYPRVARGLLLVGFSGESLATTIDWQFYRRPIDSWLAPDVDVNHDGFISRAEGNAWPEFTWPWKEGQEKVSFAEVEATQRADEDLRAAFSEAASLKIWQGQFNREPIYQKAAGLTEDLYVFTGALDVQTRPEEALRQGEACVAAGKGNCEVTIVPGLGHAMSLPKGPRKQKLLDSTLGPVDESFKSLLEKAAARFF